MAKWLSVVVERAGQSWVDCTATRQKRGWLLRPMGKLANLAPGTPVWVTRADENRAWGTPAKGFLVTAVRGQGSFWGLGSPRGGVWLPIRLSAWPQIPEKCVLGKSTLDRDYGGFWSKKGGYYVEGYNVFYDYYLLDSTNSKSQVVLEQILARAACKEVMKAAYPHTGEWSETEGGWRRMVSPWIWEAIVEPCRGFLEKLPGDTVTRQAFGSYIGASLQHTVAAAVASVPFEEFFRQRKLPELLLKEGIGALKWGTWADVHQTNFLRFVVGQLPQLLADELQRQK